MALLRWLLLRETEGRFDGLDNISLGNFRRGLGGMDNCVLQRPRGLGDGAFACSLLFPTLCHQKPPLESASVITQVIRSLMYESVRRRVRVFPFFLPAPEVTQCCPHHYLGGRHVRESSLDCRCDPRSDPP